MKLRNSKLLLRCVYCGSFALKVFCLKEKPMEFYSKCPVQYENGCWKEIQIVFVVMEENIRKTDFQSNACGC